MKEKAFTDLEKQELLQILFVNKIEAPGLQGLVTRLAESIGNDEQRKVAIAMTARYLASLGKGEEAQALVHSHLQGAAEATALVGIGSEIVKFSPVEAAAYFQRASETLSKLQDSDDRVCLLQHLANGYLNLNEFATAWNMASQIPVPAERIHTLTKIARRMWDEHNEEEAEQLLLEVRNSVNETAPHDRADTLDDIAQLLVHMGRAKDALGMWEEALKFVGESLDPPKLLFIICKRLVSMHQHDRVREIAMSIENQARKSQVLALIERH
jgi:tetratricopeptide (TPR) repeat protein